MCCKNEEEELIEAWEESSQPAWLYRSPPSTHLLMMAVRHKEGTLGLKPELATRGWFPYLPSWILIINVALGGRETAYKDHRWSPHPLDAESVYTISSLVPGTRGQAAKLLENRRPHGQPANPRDKESKTASAGYAPL